MTLRGYCKTRTDYRPGADKTWHEALTDKITDAEAALRKVKVSLGYPVETS
jgi:hypothetical protein